MVSYTFKKCGTDRIWVQDTNHSVFNTRDLMCTLRNNTKLPNCTFPCCWRMFCTFSMLFFQPGKMTGVALIRYIITSVVRLCPLHCFFGAIPAVSLPHYQCYWITGSESTASLTRIMNELC